MISVKRDSEMLISRVKDSGFKRYVDQMQDPVEGRVTSGPRDFAENGETISQVLTGGISVLMCFVGALKIGEESRYLVGYLGGR